AKQVVLAAGGLQTARLLLTCQAQDATLFGGPNGALGRYYMGHLTGSVAEIHFRDAAHVGAFGYAPLGSTMARRRIMLDPHHWANTAFWLESVALNDPRHQSGELSFKHLLASRGRTADLLPHIRNVLTNPAGVPAGIKAALERRFLPHARYPNRLIARGPGPYRLAFHAEQRPLASNRVSLANEQDRFGCPKLKIDFHYDDETIWALVRDHRKLAEQLSGNGLADLTLPGSDDDMAEQIARQSRDGYHQIGVCRMTDDPSTGIVDPDCKVWGIRNLYVASAAVFPVGGQANPTLSVVALALRLAEHLRKSHIPSSPKEGTQLQ
ncbi:MAG: GMC family oxidoreductase, partial [Pseudomonadota bacterium]